MEYEIIIVGGGLIGSTVALGLSQQGCSVALVDPQPLVPLHAVETPALRITALNIASVTLLKRLGVWSTLATECMAPYRTVSVFGNTQEQLHFCAHELGLPYLGYNIENQCLLQALWKQLRQQKTVTCYIPDSMQQMFRIPGGWRMQLGSGKELTARWVVGADGTHSTVRKQALGGVSGHYYQQHCLLITVRTDMLWQKECNWLHFDNGRPKAYLPLKAGWASLAWYDSPTQIRYLATLDPLQLATAIQAAYPTELGRVIVEASGSFPLVMQRAHHMSCERLLLLGDAFHTIHPLAGQGVNLGLRDVAALLQWVVQKKADHCSTELGTLLPHYQQQRQLDHTLMQVGNALLYRYAKGGSPPIVSQLGSFFITAVQRIATLRHLLLFYFLGLHRQGGINNRCDKEIP